AKPYVLVRPPAVHFAFAAGVASPESRTVRITSKATGLTFTATATTAKGGKWLAITPNSGNVPGTITASINTSVASTLTPGIYTGNIEVKVPGAAQEIHNVHVALRVPAPEDMAEFEIEPGGIVFKATLGGANPATQKVELEAEGVATIAWNAA